MMISGSVSRRLSSSLPWRCRFPRPGYYSCYHSYYYPSIGSSRRRRRERGQRQQRPFSVLNRPPPNYPGHVPLTWWEQGVLAVGSAVGAMWNPYRHDLVAACGEATATPFFIYRLRDVMLSSATGRRILRDRPRITSRTLPLAHLRTLPEGSVGRTYAAWLDREGVTPDTRDPVRHIDDEECAYVMQRYRECHDFYHALTGLPVWVEGELALKAFEFSNTLLPMTGLSVFAAAVFSSSFSSSSSSQKRKILLDRPEQRQRFWSIYLPWAVRNGVMGKDVINVYWEEELERDVDELRRELRIERPPDLREMRRLLREQRKKEKEKAEKEKEKEAKSG